MSAFTPSNQRVDIASRVRSASEVSGAAGVTGQRGPPERQLNLLLVSVSVPPERQLTIMLVSVCVAFVCLRLPYTISYALYEFTKDPKSPRSPAEELSYLLAKLITDVIATTNYTVNFFLYGLCGSYFRQQVRAAFCCRRGGRGGWAAGRQLQQGRQSRSGSGLSTRTTDLITTRQSIRSETINLNVHRRSRGFELPPIQS